MIIRLFPQANSPDPQQAPTPVGEISGEVDHLEEGKPLQRFEVAITILERNDAVLRTLGLAMQTQPLFSPTWS
jgi:hypothetical protein